MRLKQTIPSREVSPRQRRRLNPVRLLAGPEPAAVADDPEAKEVLSELIDRYVHLPHWIQEDVALLSLPMGSREQNALIVNALQRCSSVVVQNSLREGFCIKNRSTPVGCARSPGFECLPVRGRGKLQRMLGRGSLRGRTALAATLLMALVPAALAQEGEDGWQPVDDADGVQVWRKQMPGSAYLAFRGVATVEVPVARLVGLLTDSSKGIEWVDRLIESARLREPAEGESVLYNRYDLAWPVQDRDYVLHRRIEIDAGRQVVTATYRSTEDPARPEQECCVRALANRTFWRFTRLGPERTRVEVEVFTDPRGSLPSWVVNLIQRSWPRNSILHLAERAAAPDTTPYPPLAGW